MQSEYVINYNSKHSQSDVWSHFVVFVELKPPLVKYHSFIK